jgi:hypothetical protein
VCLALDSFKELVKAKAAIPAPLLNHFLQCVCDACPCFLGHFASNNRAFVLKFLLFTFKEFLPLLEMQTVLKMMEACVLMRHEDKKLMISKHMLDHLVTLTTRCLPCPSTNLGKSPVHFPSPTHRLSHPCARPLIFNGSCRLALRAFGTSGGMCITTPAAHARRHA